MQKDAVMLPAAAQVIVNRFGLQKNYEGVYLKRIYEQEGQGDGRAAATSIYSLVAYAAPSFLHRLDCDELWHFYAGMPLYIYFFKPEGLQIKVLGNDLQKGEMPFVSVPGGTIFGAAVQKPEDWCFCGCTCIPGFDLAHCEFIKKDNAELDQFKEHEELIKYLTNFSETKNCSSNKMLER